MIHKMTSQESWCVLSCTSLSCKDDLTITLCNWYFEFLAPHSQKLNQARDMEKLILILFLFFESFNLYIK